MLESEDDGEDGPGDATSSGVALGRNVLDSYVGEAAMGTARLLDIGVWDWGPCVGFTVAPLYWVACEWIGLEMGRIVSLECVCSFICGRLDITGESGRRPTSLATLSGVGT